MSLELSLSDRCNLRCSFCYTRGGGGNGPDWNRTERTLCWYFDENPDAERSISVFGGEPLVEWTDLLRLLDWRDAREQTDGKRLTVGIITNMTLLTAERLEVLRKRRVRISPSIDGNAAAQDACRVFADGRGSSAVVYENARRLLKVRPMLSVRATFSPATIEHMADSVQFLHEDLGFRMVNAVQAGGVDWTPKALATFDAQLSRITDWFIERTRADYKNRPNLYHVRNLAKALWHEARGQRVSTCKVGRGRMAIDTNSNIWPCHRFANPNSDPAWRLGTIEEGITNPNLVRQIARFNPGRDIMKGALCHACTAQSICYAMCWWEIMSDGRSRTLKDGRIQIRPSAAWCHIWRGYYREGRRALEVLKADGIDPHPPQKQKPAKKKTPVPAVTCEGCSGNCQQKKAGAVA